MLRGGFPVAIAGDPESTGPETKTRGPRRRLVETPGPAQDARSSAEPAAAGGSGPRGPRVRGLGYVNFFLKGEKTS